MALCMEPCCNAEARARIKAERLAAFEAWLAERDTSVAVATLPTIPTAPTVEGNDLSYAEAVERLNSAGFTEK